jgi:DNA polymerase III subunit chi
MEPLKSQSAYFYLLQDDTPQIYTRSVCRLVDQLWCQQYTVYLYCQTKEIAEQFDNDLWTFRDIRFIPHGLITDPQLQQIALPFCTIGFPSAGSIPYAGDVLFNLTDTVPEFFTQYQKIIELVSTDEAARVSSRQRYKQYQKAGYQMKTSQYQEH